MKKILTIQDLSCTENCSMKIAIPILSVANLEVSVLPTMLLSSPTGNGYLPKKYSMVSYTKQIMEEWKNKGLNFSAVYCGYLGNIEAIDLAIEVLKKQTRSTIVIDPAMADHGKLYSYMKQDIILKMKELICLANIITPNFTELCFLSDVPYEERLYKKEEIEEIILKCKTQTSAAIVVTSVPMENDNIGCVIYHNKEERFQYFQHEKLNVMVGGSGDLFTSCLVGCILNGHTLESAVDISMQICFYCMKDTITEKLTYIRFEQQLELYMKLCKKV